MSYKIVFSTVTLISGDVFYEWNIVNTSSPVTSMTTMPEYGTTVIDSGLASSRDAAIADAYNTFLHKYYDDRSLWVALNAKWLNRYKNDITNGAGNRRIDRFLHTVIPISEINQPSVDVNHFPPSWGTALLYQL